MQEKTKKEKAEEELRKWYKDHFIHLDDDKERGKKINKALEDSFINRAKEGSL
tara:strand:- start:630 stop:788 length:159 start_codon:yes stop_codon:yes gene_type:complete